MEDEGKYVRATGSSESGPDESHNLEDTIKETNEIESSCEGDQEQGDQLSDCTSSTSCSTTSDSSVYSPPVPPPPSSESEDRMDPRRSLVIGTSTEEPREAKSGSVEKIERLQKVIADLTKSLSAYQRPNNATHRDVDDNWAGPYDSTGYTDVTQAAVRWDHIKPFPNGIPANKMWEEWNRFIENFEIAASLGNAANPVQRSKLLFLCLGQELQGIVRAAQLRPSLAEPDCYTVFVKNVRNYLQSMTDTAAEHEAFAGMMQGTGESAVAFHARLQEKVRLCGYSPSDQERFVRAQLLKGLRNRELTKTARIYSYQTNFIVQSATREEAYEAETAQPSGSNISAVHQRYRKSPTEMHQKRRKEGQDDRHPTKRYRSFDKQSHGRRNRCYRCNRPSHRSGTTCPALDKNCNGCGERGHFIASCRKRRVNNVRRDTESNPAGWTDEENEEKKQVNILSLNDVLINCCVGSSSSITFLIDSGADVNVIGGNDWKLLKREFHLGRAELNPVQPPADSGLHAYGSGKPITVNAAFRAEIVAFESSKPPIETLFYVASEGRRSLLGRSTASDMGLLHVGAAINSCEIPNEAQVFPKMPGIKIKFSVDKRVVPVKNAYYNVPAAYREGARIRLQEMETRGIIERVTKAPEWISGMSAVAKGKDDFRLVVNMRGPNKAINREYYRLPLIEEMKVKLHGARYFSKLDLSNAYYHLELSNESRDLTTFLTESGMFRFTRLMFGVNCAPEIFQREMVRILEDVDDVIVYIDDILVHAATLEELRKTVAKVLHILRANNLTINTDKCEFDMSRIKFLGHELDKDGFHIEEAKVKSIQCFREPVSVSELRSFLGLASFVSPHVQNFADISSPLWSATTSWNWGPDQKKAFNIIKERIIQCTIAQGFFSEDDKTILYTDASPVALGAVLVQEDNHARRIISFASKALTKTEKSYPQNQREALAAVWAVEHFSYFLLGRRFILRTDAQGVTFILNRTREESKRALTRADGWALRLSPYDYDVEYIRGRDNIADASSRLYNGNDDPFEEQISPWEIASLEANSVSFLTKDEVKEATAKDETLLLVIQSLHTGTWPEHLRKFEKLESDLSTRDDIVVKTGCAVIPESLRKKALEVAHIGHPSASKMKSILRQRVWWPGMATDAERWVEACATCALNGRPEKTTPMQRIFAPKSVWETIALDFNGPYVQFGGISILVVVDYRSRYLVARPVKSTSFYHMKAILEAIFEREGFPANIKTDNGPPFNGSEYKTYCYERDIHTIYSTPLFPQQNGLVEGYMKVINKAMCTASSDKTNFVDELRAAVDAHNAATHRVTKLAPEEVMMGRKIKRGLPLLRHESSTIDDDLFEQRDRESKLLAKQREDARRGARQCRVKPGDIVIVERSSRAKGETRFSPMRYTVVEEQNGSLTLSNEAGQILKRHVSQTKKVCTWRDSSDTVPENQAEPAQQAKPAQQAEPVQQADQQNSTRKKRTPAYLKDYVKTVAIQKL
ncbi:uncharacterized protein K02A2.6-like [Ochlerotatus camptorhynchus]|uniref:uncharacterized protein K02A2.6-like n=1 Tax=Ochlerotatus camptorhynchus TaxID=644619 RepID=UPI0031D2DA1A